VKRPRWTDPARRALEDYFAGQEPSLDLKLDLAEGSGSSGGLGSHAAGALRQIELQVEGRLWPAK